MGSRVTGSVGSCGGAWLAGIGLPTLSGCCGLYIPLEKPDWGDTAIDSAADTAEDRVWLFVDARARDDGSELLARGGLWRGIVDTEDPWSDLFQGGGFTPEGVALDPGDVIEVTAGDVTVPLSTFDSDWGLWTATIPTPAPGTVVSATVTHEGETHAAQATVPEPFVVLQPLPRTRLSWSGGVVEWAPTSDSLMRVGMFGDGGDDWGAWSRAFADEGRFVFGDGSDPPPGVLIADSAVLGVVREEAACTAGACMLVAQERDVHVEMTP